MPELLFRHALRIRFQLNRARPSNAMSLCKPQAASRKLTHAASALPDTCCAACVTFAALCHNRLEFAFAN